MLFFGVPQAPRVLLFRSTGQHPPATAGSPGTGLPPAAGQPPGEYTWPLIAAAASLSPFQHDGRAGWGVPAGGLRRSTAWHPHVWATPPLPASSTSHPRPPLRGGVMFDSVISPRITTPKNVKSERLRELISSKNRSSMEASR